MKHKIFTFLSVFIMLAVIEIALALFVTFDQPVMMLNLKLSLVIPFMVVLGMWFGWPGVAAAYVASIMGFGFRQGMPITVNLYWSVGSAFLVAVPVLAFWMFNADPGLRRKRDWFVFLAFGWWINAKLAAVWGAVMLVIGAQIDWLNLIPTFDAWFFGSLGVTIIVAPLLLKMLTPVLEHWGWVPRQYFPVQFNTSLAIAESRMGIVSGIVTDTMPAYQRRNEMPIKARVGIIGGTGLYEMDGLAEVETINIDTPFGKPSDVIVTGKLNGVSLAFLPRHGRGHYILPTELPSRANIYALKSMGVEYIIAVNACGSFKEELEPGTLLIPDQLIDLTKSRPNTFFGNGIVAHISMADPFCKELSQTLFRAGKDAGAKIIHGGTFIAIEGPAFSTRAESRLYRSWGADIVGMTVSPEAKLAREAEICYATIACVTDFDCWKSDTAAVTAEVILKCLHNNVEISKKIINLAVGNLPEVRNDECSRALATSIVTRHDLITPEQKKDLAPIIGKYVT